MAKKKSSRKKARRLTAAQIKKIKRLTSAGGTLRSIAKAIGCMPSTVWRWQNA